MPEHTHNLTDIRLTECSLVPDGDNPGAQIVLKKSRDDDEQIIADAIRKVREESRDALQATLAKVGTVPNAEIRLDAAEIAFKRHPDLMPDEAIADFLKSADGQTLRKRMVAGSHDRDQHPTTESELHKAASESRETKLLQLAEREGISYREAHERLKAQETN